MTDVSDRATEREEAQREDALEQQAYRAGLRGKTFNDSAMNCRVCDEPIPMERRKAVPGVQTCVECQAMLERGVK